MSASGVPIEHISRLAGHRSTVVAMTVYRTQIRPVLMRGADVTDTLFAAGDNGKRLRMSRSGFFQDRYEGVVAGGRYWVRTSDPSLVRRVLYR